MAFENMTPSDWRVHRGSFLINDLSIWDGPKHYEWHHSRQTALGCIESRLSEPRQASQ